MLVIELLKDSTPKVGLKKGKYVAYKASKICGEGNEYVIADLTGGIISTVPAKMLSILIDVDVIKVLFNSGEEE